MARSPSLIARSAQSTPLSTSPHSKKGEDVAHLAVVPLGPEVGAVGCVNPPESPPFSGKSRLLIARSAQSTPLSTSPHSKKGEDVAHLAVVPLGPEVGDIFTLLAV